MESGAELLVDAGQLRTWQKDPKRLGGAVGRQPRGRPNLAASPPQPQPQHLGWMLPLGGMRLDSR